MLAIVASWCMTAYEDSAHDVWHPAGPIRSESGLALDLVHQKGPTPLSEGRWAWPSGDRLRVAGEGAGKANVLAREETGEGMGEFRRLETAGRRNGEMKGPEATR